MTDIVERLRVMSRYEHDDLTIGDEAADEIEHQQLCIRDLNGILNKRLDEIERLRAALTEVVRVYDRMGSVYVPANEIDAAFDKASTALKEPT